MAVTQGASPLSPYGTVPAKFYLQAPGGAAVDVRTLGHQPGWVLCKKRASGTVSAVCGTQIPTGHEVVR